MSENSTPTRETWVPQTYTISTGYMPTEAAETAVETDTVTVQGEVWGAFGIARSEGGYCVTHLATGRQIVTTHTREAAKQFCSDVAPLLDWESAEVGVKLSPSVDAAFQKAWERANGRITYLDGGIRGRRVITSPAAVAEAAP